MFVLLIGVIADLISTNRKLLEQIDWKIKQLQESTRDLGAPAEPQVVIDQRQLQERLDAPETRRPQSSQPASERRTSARSK